MDEEKADKIMQEITKDENLCIIRKALENYEEPKKFKVDLYGCPEFIYAKDLAEAERELLGHIDLSETDEEDDE